MGGTRRVAEQNEDLRALLNAGHQQNRPVLRTVGPTHIPTPFSTFCFAALAGIGGLPDTITDRAVNVTMRRRLPGETVRQFRSRRDEPGLHDLRARVADWTAQHIAELRNAEPAMPVEDRAADTWEPLVAIADLAGGQWPELARNACRKMNAEHDADDADDSESVRLITDIKVVFEDQHLSFIASAELLAGLRHLAESPWRDAELTTQGLASRLRQFGIRPGFNSSKTLRGYHLPDFADTFRAYIRPKSSEPSESASDQGERADDLKSTDDLVVRGKTGRPDISPSQNGFRTARTTADDPSPENGTLTNGHPLIVGDRAPH